MPKESNKQNPAQGSGAARAAGAFEVAALAAVLLAALTLSVLSLVSTSEIDPSAYDSGRILFVKDSFWLNIALLFITFAIVRSLRLAQVSNRVVRRLTVTLLVFVAISGLLWSF
jgi:hypothetical protein